jgi:hypothetical protein
MNDFEPEEPCFLTPEDDKSMLDPPTELPIGPPWWEGRWPRGGIDSLDGLERWVNDRLELMIELNWSTPDTLGPIGTALGRQAVKNALRYLARFGKFPAPPRPTIDKLERPDDIESELETILRHIREEEGRGDAVALSEPSAAENPRTNEPTSRQSSKEPPKQTWSKVDLNNAIRKYKAYRANEYPELVKGVRQGLPGAIKAARKIYGRNVIVRALGVKSSSMVSNSPAWREIADDLNLVPSSGDSRKSLGSMTRHNLDLVVDNHGEGTRDAVLDIVVDRETYALVRRSMPEPQASQVIERLHAGTLSDEDARVMVDMYEEQKKDSKSDRAY